MVCERCYKDTNSYTCSMFNTQMICMECKKKETKHPLYKRAVEKEREECLKGNYNFEGIGLPQNI